MLELLDCLTTVFELSDHRAGDAYEICDVIQEL